VQGVNYRTRVAESARRRGIVGTVENRPDGTVLIDAQGPAATIEEFLCDIRGARGLSRADSVERVTDLPIDPKVLSFDIVP
jgi:acylphosphatase